MKKSLIALALVGAFAAPAFAQTAAPAAEAEASPHTFTGNMTLATEYRFRGIAQTFAKPALQGGFDYSHSSGIYVGNWNSNVNSGAGFAEGNLEMDFYGGYKATFGDFGIDVGGIYYYYPGSDDLSGSTVKNGELYIGGSWKFISAKYYYAVTDYFSLKSPAGKDTDGTGYFDLSANYDLGNGWGVNGHIGYLDFKHSSAWSYTDWKLGVTKDINGWVIGLAYIDSDADGDCGKGQFYCFTNSLDANGVTGSKNMNAGRATGVLSVTKSF